MQDAAINPAALVCEAEDIASLVARARAEHAAAERSEEEVGEHRRQCGQALIKLKAACGFGRWEKELSKTGISSQRASEYRRVAEYWAQIPDPRGFGIQRFLSEVDALRMRQAAEQQRKE